MVGFVVAAGLLAAPPPRLDADGLPLPPEAVSRVGSARFRGAGYIRDVHCTPDGRTLIAADRTDLVAWDAATGVPLYRQPLPESAHPYLATRLALTPDGRELRVESRTDGRAFVVTRFAPRTGRRGPPETLLINTWGNEWLSPSGRMLLREYTDVVRRYSIDETDHVLEVRRDDRAVEVYRSKTPFRATARADDRMIAVFGSAKDGVPAFATLIDLATRAARPLALDGAEVGPLVFTPDGAGVVGTYGDKDRPLTTAVWDTATGRRRDVVRDTHDACVWAVSATPAGGLLGVTTYAVWDLRTGAVLLTVRDPDQVEAVAPDGRTAFVRTASRVVPVELPGGRPRPAAEDLSPHKMIGLDARGRLLAWSAGERVAAWDAGTGRLLARGVAIPGTPDRVSPDGRAVVWYGSVDGRITVTIRDTATGGVRAVCRDHPRDLVASRFTPDSRYLITITAGRFFRWDAGTGQLLGSGSLPGFDGQSFQGGLAAFDVRPRIDVSRDGRLVAPVGNGDALLGDMKLCVWNIITPGDGVRLPQAAPVLTAIAFSADGRRVVACGVAPEGFGGGAFRRVGVFVWDITSRQLLVRSAVPGKLTPPAISPDGRTVAVGSDQSPGVQLIEVTTGAIRHTFRGHVAPVSDVVFSADGRRLAAASPDAPVFVWDVRGELSKPPAPPTAAQLAAAVNDLGSTDAAAAFRAVRLLAHFPDHSLPRLRAALPPATPLPPGRVEQLVADLDAPRFADRDAASRELRRLGPLAATALRKAMADSPSAEVRQRAEPLLAAIDAAKPAPDDLRAVRAVEAVEWVGTPAARALLTAWATGADGHRLTTEAKQAVAR